MIPASRDAGQLSRQSAQAAGMRQGIIEFAPGGRGLFEITPQISRQVAESALEVGLCHLFIRHTSASLILCENADPDVLGDLERYMQDLVRDGDSRFRHRAEGPDDMSAHVRSVLTASQLTIPVAEGKLLLGTWQGVYLWEHRYGSRPRQVVVTLC